MVILAGQWEVIEKLSEGTFGQVFSALNIRTNSRVAVKREPVSIDYPQLEHERDMYSCLFQPIKNQNLDRPIGIPKVFHMGVEGNWNILVMEQLGPSLREIQNSSPTGKLSLRAVAYCGMELINRFQFIHSKGIVFRDVKPDQFCVGNVNNPKDQTIYVVDFGLSSFYRDPVTKRHIPFRKPMKGRSRVGTARYASVNVHEGYDHTRRDDLESLAYVLIDLAKASLPWMGIKASSSREGWAKIRIRKREATLYEICGNLPNEFAKYLDYTRNLGFMEEPDYLYCYKLFEQLYRRLTPYNSFNRRHGFKDRIEWIEN
ncbi:binary complex of casein kinase-1 with Cki7 [Neocallimastix lanati (nom. inval.)]|uniref:Binary complex of casein kinase-1 with Cki7 n=1 Tax=Neocallimastix californiae TaxID=1754190 RepID=A0A1Y1ZUJ1_9FUNG|nr:binary complex of casein kinase-1 with Cki7 [Neocallimastix sp. JGI-2020a]ORY13884.1 binary complex of casein kinase-1 with Cki7 [Neocallimastix californiae]|eukprot:ORY13884.1 binary complex of casein kinase-1 with Cki7 [Neocallimastix californiae]